MKRFSLFLFALVLAVTAFAGTYSITTTAAQDTRLDRHRLRVNKATCASVSLPPACTQAQARAVTPGLNIYSDVGDMIDRLILKGFLDGLKSVDTSDDNAQAQLSWTAKSDADKNAVCALFGLPAGCEVFPR